MVRHAPIHRRSGHSDTAICCGRNVRGSSLSTSVVPLSNQVTTLNHKRFKGFKMFSDGHLDMFDTPCPTEATRLAPHAEYDGHRCNLSHLQESPPNTMKRGAPTDRAFSVS